MTAIAVVFTLWLCPGSFAVLGMPVQLARLPDAAKPALGFLGACQARPTVELYDPARAAEARRRVLALGKPAQMFACEGVVCGPALVDWSTVATFKETP